MRNYGGMLPVAALSSQLWVKGLPAGMSATEMDMAHRIAVGGFGTPSANRRSSPDLSTPLAQSNPDFLWYDPAVSAEFRLILAPPSPLQCLAAPTSNPS